jgi:parvulin-like peptidyl-prolyl isomerase
MVTLTTCGGGAARPQAGNTGPAATSTVDPGGEPNAVIVAVGAHPITRATFDHVFSGLVRSQGPGAVAPVPPDFSACIKHLEATSAASQANGSTSSTAALKSACQSEYQKFEKQALDSLIVQQWVIGGAAEAGVTISRDEVARAVRKAEAGKSPQQVEQVLANTGRTLADFEVGTRVMLLGEAIRNLFKQRTRHVSDALVAKYYDEHKSGFAVPKGRALEIVRAGSKAEALKIKAEIAAGRSFASVARTLQASLQPIYSKGGFVRRYEPRLYQEAPLDHAIFAARPSVLSGPVGISLGYYVFRVTRTYPPHQYTFAEVQSRIRAELSNLLYKQELTSFITTWRRRWRPRTDCQPGYVVPKCRQFSSSSSKPEQEDPYTFN